MKETALPIVHRGAAYVAVFFLALVAGCASQPAPLEEMALARAAMNDAGSAGASEYAPIEFRAAMEKLNAAERAVGDKDYEQARLLAEQAEVDARLASAKARSEKARKAADAVQENIRVLRQEMERVAP